MVSCTCSLYALPSTHLPKLTRNQAAIPIIFGEDRGWGSVPAALPNLATLVNQLVGGYITKLTPCIGRYAVRRVNQLGLLEEVFREIP